MIIVESHIPAMKQRIFSDRSLLRGEERYVTMLYPFWGPIQEPRGDKDEGRFDGYSNYGKNFFTFVSSLPESDVVVLPYEWKSKKQWKSQYEKYIEEANELAKEAKIFNKRLIIFFNNDSDEDVPVDNSIIFRTSFNRSERKINEFAVPGWSVDFLSRYLGGTLKIRKKSIFPTVGYCGYIDNRFILKNNLFMQAVKKLSWYRPNIGASLRGTAIRALLARKQDKNEFYISGRVRRSSWK